MVKTVTSRVPEDLAERIDDFAEENELSRSKTIELLLQEGLGENPTVKEHPSIKKELESLRNDLDSVIQRVEDNQSELASVKRTLEHTKFGIYFGWGVLVLLILLVAWALISAL